ncbi:DUF2145 domain-containing protein [Ideonella sp.]|uniref:DUF2145 domain-containing protein n=1 Tax=Ideonella sp. TaxID=1929293 RepID=UPI0035B402ED
MSLGFFAGRRFAARAAAAMLLAAASCLGAAQAASLRYCDRQAKLGIDQQDTLFRFGGIVKAELEASGRPLALMARSGLDLSWFGLRYSHAGVSLQASPNGPWSVRQLYYACDEQRPRIFDQGISGFLLGTDNPAEGYVSLVFLPPHAGAPLERSALSKPQALELLAADYSANAYPYSLRYQNCNQWVMELLASAWGGLSLAGDLADADTPRAQAQRWLQQQGYEPTVFDLLRPLMWFGAFIPWLHSEDHPADDLARAVYRVSMPASIEAFVRAQVPGATRVELCHAGRRVVIHRGWEQIADGCQPAEGDQVLMLD